MSPYIPQADRDRLDQHILALAEEIVKIESELGDTKYFAGYLNYAVSTLARYLTPERRYWAMSLVHGVLNDAAAEYYRRVMAPYEEEQIEAHGDLTY